jgi:hypothetical protein
MNEEGVFAFHFENDVEVQKKRKDERTEKKERKREREKFFKIFASHFSQRPPRERGRK